jgi:hypothetical protein
MEDVLHRVAEYLYSKTFLSFRIISKRYYDKSNLNDLLLNKYIQKIKAQRFLNKKYTLNSILYPPRLVRQTNRETTEYKYALYYPLESLRRGPEELYKTDYKLYKIA